MFIFYKKKIIKHGIEKLDQKAWLFEESDV